MQTNMNGCVCLTCEICQERLILLGSKCSCVFSETELELCNRCKKLEERRWVQTVSKKAVWLTRKSKLAMGCVSQGKIMTDWVSNPISLMNDDEREWLYQLIGLMKLPSPSYTEPLEEGACLTKLLTDITCLDAWEKVVSHNLIDPDSLILVKRQGQYESSSVVQVVISEMKNLELNSKDHNWETRTWESGVRETAITILARSQRIMTGRTWFKIKNDANSASKIMRMTVNLCCTRGFMGVGMCIQGIHIEWKTVNKSMKERMGDWLLRKRKKGQVGNFSVF